MNLWKQIRPDLTSPFQAGSSYTPARTIRSKFYMVPNFALMPGKPYSIVFNYPNVGPMAQVEQSWPLGHHFQLTAITGVYIPAAGQTGTLDFQVSINHNVNQIGADGEPIQLIRAITNKPIQSGALVGSGRLPNYLAQSTLKEIVGVTYPLRAGDSISVVVNNLSSDPTLLGRIQVALHGTIIQVMHP